MEVFDEVLDDQNMVRKKARQLVFELMLLPLSNEIMFTKLEKTLLRFL